MGSYHTGLAHFYCYLSKSQALLKQKLLFALIPSNQNFVDQTAASNYLEKGINLGEKEYNGEKKCELLKFISSQNRKQ